MTQKEALLDIHRQLAVIERRLSTETLSKAERFSKLRFLTSEFKLSVDSVKPRLLEDGSIELVVSYKVPELIIKERDGEAIYDPRIVSINLLDLITIEDMDKISNAVAKYLPSKK